MNSIEKEKRIFFIILFLIDFIIFYLSHYFSDLYLIQKNIPKLIENKPLIKNEKIIIKEKPQIILKKDLQKTIILKEEIEDPIEFDDDKGEDVYLLPM